MAQGRGQESAGQLSRARHRGGQQVSGGGGDNDDDDDDDDDDYDECDDGDDDDYVRRDTGTYSCTATNDLGQSAPGYVDVETHCK